MSLMHWNDNYSVGVGSIDADHKKLVGMVNDLFDGVKEGKGVGAVGQILDGLIAYTVEHFDREERYFAQTGYPDTAAHKAEHEDLKKQVLEIQAKFRAGNSAVTMETMSFLKNWLINHIQGSDKKYGSHLNSHGVH